MRWKAAAKKKINIQVERFSDFQTEWKETNMFVYMHETFSFIQLNWHTIGMH